MHDGDRRGHSSTDRERARIHWMEELAPLGIFTTDKDLRIETWNRWLEDHSGVAAAAVVGRSLLEAFPELVSRNLDVHYRCAIEGQVSILSTALHGYLLSFPPTVRDSGYAQMRQTGRIGPLVLNGAVTGTITTIQDVTQREAQARLLRQRADDLESKVHERTLRLNDLVSQLESFSYTVAHDLRAPIRAFKGYIEILKDDFELPGNAGEYVDRMRRAADGMDLLTRDLLQLSRVSRQQVIQEPVCLESLVDELVAQTPSLRQPGLLTVRKPLHDVLGNRTMVRQCLWNLLDNALKFAEAERALRITIWTERHSRGESLETPAAPAPFISATADLPDESVADLRGGGARVRLVVEDNGIGIPAEHHRKVFGIFERVHGQRQDEGTGIGLAIVARAAHRMFGSCGVESKIGEGSKFWIELPAPEAGPSEMLA